SPLGTSSTSSMVRTTLPSQPLTSEQIQLPARTRPLPVLSPLHQPRRYRIGMNVVHCRSQMTLIADIAIPITSHPDAPTLQPQTHPPLRPLPRPVPTPLHPPRRYRIGMNVVHCRSQMTLIADIAIPITSHPDAPTLQPQTQPFVMLHRPAGTVGLPALHYAR